MRILSVILLLRASLVFAGGSLELFNDANAAFEKGNYVEAARDFEQIRDGGLYSAEMFVNLGHAYFRQNDFARAILNYERALLLHPNDRAIRTDLALARKRAGLDPEVAESLFFIENWWQNLRSLLAPDAWAYLAVVLFWLSMSGVWLWFFDKSRRFERLGKWLALALLPAFLLTLPLALDGAHRASNPAVGIVVEKDAPFLPSPDTSENPLDKLPAGTKVLEPQRLGEFWKAKLPGGEEGFLAEKAVEML